jgi:hypothetical protein
MCKECNKSQKQNKEFPFAIDSVQFVSNFYFYLKINKNKNNESQQ